MALKYKYMQLQALDRHLMQVQVCEHPSGGWIRAIRTSLSMNVRQLAERIGISQQSAAKLEEHEARGAITLKSLRKAAEAMDCKLVYALVPNEGNLENFIRKQALKKAKEIVDPVNQSMVLEDQGVGNKQEKIKQMADELIENLNSKLWD